MGIEFVGRNRIDQQEVLQEEEDNVVCKMLYLTKNIQWTSYYSEAK